MVLREKEEKNLVRVVKRSEGGKACSVKGMNGRNNAGKTKKSEMPPPLT